MSPKPATRPTNLDEALRELQTAAKAHDDAFRAATPAIDPSHMSKAPSWPIGARVLDLVTGVKGTVIDGKRENILLPASSRAGS